MSHRRPPGRCPVCGGRVREPEEFEGMWTGARPGGGPADGGVHVTRCRLCRARLEAYSDVYDETGRIVPGRSELTWSLRGVPWQTIALLLTAAAAIWALLRGAWRLVG